MSSSEPPIAAFSSTTTEVTAYSGPVDSITAEMYASYHYGLVGSRFGICLLGLWTNAINIRTFYRIGLFDSVTIVFFFISVSDLFVVFGFFLDTCTRSVIVIQEHYSFPLPFPPNVLNTLITILARAFSEITCVTTALLALQRCLCVAMPLRFNGMFTRPRIFSIMGVIWLFWISFTLVFAVYNCDVKKIYNPVTNSSTYVVALRPGRDAVTHVYTTLLMILSPFYQVVTIVGIVVMVTVLRKSVKFRKQATRPAVGSNKVDSQEPSNDVMANTKERQAIVQVSLVATIFLFCNAIRIMICIAVLVEPEFDFMRAYHYTFVVVYNVLVTVELISSSVNFFVYYKYNSKFRSLWFGPKESRI